MTKVAMGENEILTYDINPGSCFTIVELLRHFSNMSVNLKKYIRP